MKKIINRTGMVIVSSVLLLLSPLTINAKADYYNNFVVKPNFPSNQIKGQENYFDLLVEPNQKQTITIDITNNGQEEMDAVIELYNGSTGDNATKQYLSAVENDVTLKNPFDKLATVKNPNLKLKPGQTQVVEIDMTMPEESFDGVVLGGIRVYSDTKTDDKNKDNKQINFQNRINYIVGTQLRMTDKDIKENLNLQSYGAKINSYNEVFYANIQNDQAVLMNDVDVKGTIYKSGTREVVATVDVVGGGILPNSNFDVVYRSEKDIIKKGVYDLELKIEDEKDSWEWRETFEVTSKDVETLKENPLSKRETPWAMIVIAILVLIITILFIILFLKREKEEEEEK